MSDISKCDRKGCKAKDTCWRFLAPTGSWQSYIEGQPEKGKDCTMYWKATPAKPAKPKKKR